jgi:inhibitor of KinA
MNIRPTRIFPLGDNAATVEFGNELSVELNGAAVSLANHFMTDPFPGFVEAVPAMASATIFYRSHEVRRRNENFETAFAAVRSMILDAVDRLALNGQDRGRQISIPVSFLPDDALDLLTIAENCGLSSDEVIDIFVSTEYRVFMLGFLPGFTYMGVVDDRIAVPRRATPRVSVPKGSVGIAGRQAGIYPSASPGGWQIVGRTDANLFAPKNDPPCLFAPGDRVRFVRA